MIPQGQISLPVSMEGKEVITTFIVVDSFSPYTAILGRPSVDLRDGSHPVDSTYEG